MTVGRACYSTQRHNSIVSDLGYIVILILTSTNGYYIFHPTDIDKQLHPTVYIDVITYQYPNPVAD